MGFFSLRYRAQALITMIIVAVACFAPGSTLRAQTITTIAGNGQTHRSSGGFSGDGGPALSALLNNPNGLARDGAGNLYFADTINQRIRKLTPQPGGGYLITTIAGTGNTFPDGFTGVPGFFNGESGTALQIDLDKPDAVAVDDLGNLFVSDAGNFRIRKLTPQTDGPYLLETIWTSPSPHVLENQSATSLVTAPGGVLLFSDFNGIHRMTPQLGSYVETLIIPTPANTGPASYPPTAPPISFTRDAAGNLYITSAPVHQIFKATPQADGTYTLSIIAGNGVQGPHTTGGFSGDNGPATQAQLNAPRGITVDAQGNVFFADADNFRIRRLTPTGDGAYTITTVAGFGKSGVSPDGVPGLQAEFNSLRNLISDDKGHLIFISGLRVQELERQADGSYRLQTLAGAGVKNDFGDNGPGSVTSLGRPIDIATGVNGDLFFTDENDERIRRLHHNVDDFYTITTVAGTGENGFSGDGGLSTDAMLDFPGGLGADRSGNLYVADRFNHRVRKLALQPDGSFLISTILGNGGTEFSGDGGPATAAGSNPWDIAADDRGNLYVTDSGRIRKLTLQSDGSYAVSTIAGNGESDSVIHGGAITGDGGPALSAPLSATYIALDSAGNLFVSEQGSYRVRKLTLQADGSYVIATIAGGGPANANRLDNVPATSVDFDPNGLTVDGSGNVYVADNQNGWIRRLTPQSDGTYWITRVAGNADAMGYNGDNIPARIAGLSNPAGVALDGEYNLYLTESGSGRVRKVNRVGSSGSPSSGDLNGDLKRDVQDVILLLRATVGLESFTSQQSAAADLNGDGKLDIRDARLLLLQIVGG